MKLKTLFNNARALGRILFVAIAVVALIIVGVAIWRIYPAPQRSQFNVHFTSLSPMTLTLVALNGTQRVLDSTEIGSLTSQVACGGCIDSSGNVSSLGNFTGVPLDELCELVGGIDSDNSLRVTALDNYSVTLSYEQVKGDFATFDNATGQKVPHKQLLTPILAYYAGNLNVSSTDGPLELAIVGPEGFVTDSTFWVKNVIKLQILNESALTVPTVNLPAMTLTLVALNGTKLVLNEKDIGSLPSFKSEGGFENSVGVFGGIGNYTGVKLSTLLALIGGINSDCSLRVTASDGYTMVYTYNQVQGENFTTYSPQTGDEVPAGQPFTIVLAYCMDDMNLSSGTGPLRFTILGSQAGAPLLLTDGHYWVKMVAKMEVLPAVADWTLVLIGPNPDNMSRAAFESGLNCHNSTWTDSSDNKWTGMPLWYLIGWIDDAGESNRMEFNDTLARQGYVVKVITGQGFSESFNSSTIARNDSIILADKLNAAPLPDPYWPLRLVGSGLLSSEMLSNVVEIQMILPGS